MLIVVVLQSLLQPVQRLKRLRRQRLHVQKEPVGRRCHRSHPLQIGLGRKLQPVKPRPALLQRWVLEQHPVVFRVDHVVPDAAIDRSTHLRAPGKIVIDNDHDPQNGVPVRLCIRPFQPVDERPAANAAGGCELLLRVSYGLPHCFEGRPVKRCQQPVLVVPCVFLFHKDLLVVRPVVELPSAYHRMAGMSTGINVTKKHFIDTSLP